MAKGMPADRGGDVNGVSCALLDDHQVDGRPPPPSPYGGRLFERLSNGGQVCHGEGCSGSDAPQDNPLDLLSPGNLSQRPDQDLAAGRLQGTAGHVPVVGSDGGPDIIQAHPVLLESGRVHLDPDLLLANSQDPDGGDPWEAAEIVSEVFGHVPERCLVDISRERDGDDREGRLHLADLGVVGLFR
jgi:hypothetical protein